MAQVDEFLDLLTADYTSLYNENAVLKSKMKVLVDKIEEYRASEDAMRMTLLSAQKLSSQIEAEARARADKVVAEAQATAARSLDGLKSETRREEARLKEAKESLARFLEDARALCQRQLDFLNGNTAAQAAPASEEAVDAAVKSIEASVARIPDEPAPQIDISPVMGERAPRQTITPDDMTRLFNMGGS